LVIKFHSRNVLSEIDKQVVLNQGVIKKLTSSYYERGRRRSLKSLTFEFTQAVPYRIWQDENAILLDLELPEDLATFPGEKMEIFKDSKIDKAIIMKLEAMDNALSEVAQTQTSLEIPEPKISIDKEVAKTEEEVILSKAALASTLKPIDKKRVRLGMLYPSIGLIIILSLGFILWNRRRLTKGQILNSLKQELQEKNKNLKHEKTIRKAVEAASLRKEKEYKLVSNSILSLEETLAKKYLTRKELSPEEKEYKQLIRSSIESLKEMLSQKDLAKEGLTPTEQPLILKKPPERRRFPRLALTQDFTRTVIIRIESNDTTEIVKAFANNIGTEGLCFGSKKDFKKKELVNLKLFFYGDRVPIMTIQGQIVWKKTVPPTSYYGISFEISDGRDRQELNRYIESKI